MEVVKIIMEFLQTLWPILITSNENLIHFISIPFTFLEIFINMLLFTTILNISSTKKQTLTYIAICSIINIFLNFLIPKSYSNFLFLIIYPILLVTIFKISFIKAIIAEILPLFAITIGEIIIIKIYQVLFHIDVNTICFVPIYRISSIILIYLLIFIIYAICKHFSINITITDSMDKKNKILLIINLSFAIIIIIIQSFLFDFYNENFPIFITLLGIFSLLAYLFTSLYSISRTTKLQITTQSLEEAKLYNKALKTLHDKVRAFKHDFSNIVLSIGGYIERNDMNGLKIYYSQLLEDCQKVNSLYALNPEVINNPAIYSLIASKYYKTEVLGITLNLEVFLDLNKLNMKIYEFTRILGILIDNAIEASKDCPNKRINIEIRKDFKVNRQILLIENTYKEKDINIDKIFTKGYSTKPNNTGLGLWEVREILKKNKNLNLYTTKDNIYFKQQLEIYPNKM